MRAVPVIGTAVNVPGGCEDCGGDAVQLHHNVCEGHLALLFDEPDESEVVDAMIADADQFANEAGPEAADEDKSRRRRVRGQTWLYREVRQATLPSAESSSMALAVT